MVHANVVERFSQMLTEPQAKMPVFCADAPILGSSVSPAKCAHALCASKGFNAIS